MALQAIVMSLGFSLDVMETQERVWIRRLTWSDKQREPWLLYSEQTIYRSKEDT